MYTIISKWSPNSNNARYLSFAEIENIVEVNNVNDQGQPIVSPEIYNVTIFSNWAVALQEYRNYFLENPYGIDYYFFIDSQGSVITVQIFDSEQTHLNVVNQSFYNDFIAARQTFANLIDVTFEIKKSSTELGLIDSYETADAAFNVI